MKANSKDSSRDEYSVEFSWSVVGPPYSKYSNFGNLAPALDNPLTMNMSRFYITHVDAGHHEKHVAKMSGRPFSSGKIDNLAKTFGLPCCDLHKDGCGQSLRPRDIVRVDASRCFLMKNFIWVVPVLKLGSNGFTCTVGFAKVIIDQLHLIGNRIAIVRRINSDDHMYVSQKAKRAPWIGKCCHGSAEAYFLDGVHVGIGEEIVEHNYGVDQEVNEKEPTDSHHDVDGNGDDDDVENQSTNKLPH